jgi:hypothetical protein
MVFPQRLNEDEDSKLSEHREGVQSSLSLALLWVMTEARLSLAPVARVGRSDRRGGRTWNRPQRLSIQIPNL